MHNSNVNLKMACFIIHETPNGRILKIKKKCDAQRNNDKKKNCVKIKRIILR
jgi:hypothetical protein